MSDLSGRLLRPKEVYDLLGVSYSTLRRWIKEGRIRAIQMLSGKYRIPEGEMRKFLEGVGKNG